MVEPDIRCHADVSALVDAVARVIAERITHWIKERGGCRFALAWSTSLILDRAKSSSRLGNFFFLRKACRSTMATPFTK